MTKCLQNSSSVTVLGRWGGGFCNVIHFQTVSTPGSLEGNKEDKETFQKAQAVTMFFFSPWNWEPEVGNQHYN